MPSKLTFISAYIGMATVAIATANLVVTMLIRIAVSDIILDGVWNEEIAEQKVIGLMKNYEKNNTFGYSELFLDSLEHEILGFYHLNSGNRKSVVAIAYTAPMTVTEGMPESKIPIIDCHLCPVSLSFVEFVNEGTGWKLGAVHIDAMEEGKRGRPPKSMKIVSIGYNIFGVVIEQEDSGQGYFGTWLTIYALVGSEYKDIFTHQVSGDDSGTFEPGQYSLFSSVRFNQVGTSYYDLIVESRGQDKGKPFSTETVYKFDGQAYSSSSFIR